MLPELLLIDDDSLIRSLWAYAAEKSGMQLKSFPSLNEFFQELETQAWPLDVPIYLDYLLPDDGPCENNLARLQSRGFNKVKVCTGFPLSEIEKNNLNAVVVTKDFPSQF